MASWKDSLRIINHLSFERTWNIMRLKISYFLSKTFKKPIVFAYPFSLSIEPTTACNLACPECPSGLKQFSRPTGKLNLELNEKILEQVRSTVFYINYYFQGEPFIHPQFLDLIRAAKKAKIYTATSTNAHFIDMKKALEIIDSGLDRLIISIDGMTQASYEQYRINGQLSKVIEASTFLVEAKRERNSSTPYLIFQFLAVKPNEKEIPAVFSLAKEIGIDEVRIKTAQFYDFKHGNSLMPEQDNYSRYSLQRNGTYKLKGRQGNHCWRMWSGSVLTWDGKVVPCCFDKDASHVLGDVSQQEFKKIWNSSAYQKFRYAVLTKRDEIEICRNCSEGTKVWS